MVDDPYDWKSMYSFLSVYVTVKIAFFFTFGGVRDKSSFSIFLSVENDLGTIDFIIDHIFTNHFFLLYLG